MAENSVSISHLKHNLRISENKLILYIMSDRFGSELNEILKEYSEIKILKSKFTKFIEICKILWLVKLITGIIIYCCQCVSLFFNQNFS